LQPCLEPVAVPVPEVCHDSTPAEMGSSKMPDSDLTSPAPSARCSVKGCVFPAPPQGRAECRYHELLRSEAELFQSHQPSHLLELRAPFGIAEEESDDSPQQDRKRQAAEWDAFVLDEPV
jgi:hypothetical protein